jgi:hypothetical protein
VQLRQLDRFPISDFILNAEFRDGYSESAVIPVKKLAQYVFAHADKLISIVLGNANKNPTVWHLFTVNAYHF